MLKDDMEIFLNGKKIYKKNFSHILIYGPPGVGKSAICDYLHIVDLENFDSKDKRLQFLLQSKSLVCGAADISPKDVVRLPIWGDVLVVNLVMSEANYKRRRALRDKANPAKSKQKSFKIADFVVTDAYVLNLNVDNNSALDEQSSIKKVCMDVQSIIEAFLV